MAEKIVTIDVDKEGTFSVDLAGYKGKGCKAVADAFASAGKITREDVKPEYHEQGPGGGNYITSGR